VNFIQGDWFAPLAGARFDAIVANPPYVAADDPALASLAHEPRAALVAGADGLEALSAIAAGAGAHLAPGGRLLLEHGADQAAAVRELLRTAGLADVETRRDLAGHERASEGTQPREAVESALPMERTR
jgi:release factor glutamine methyltransferase